MLICSKVSSRSQWSDCSCFASALGLAGNPFLQLAALDMESRHDAAWANTVLFKCFQGKPKY